MKRFFFASMALAFFAAGPSFAQNNYTDDVYYTGSQAEKDAQQEARQEKAQQAASSQNTRYYNSSDPDSYQDNGDATVYNGDYGNDNEYIDYDDDSYTTRIRRFYYPMSGIGYWGGVYSPYWSNPFYANPYYGWGGWYTPGISLSFGYGPYWSNGWCMNNWYGYGGFNSWYYPYYGYGYSGGYGAGYWNGYYSGLYDGNNNYAPARRVNYGPRGARNNAHAVGNYGNSSRTSPINRDGMVYPQRAAIQPSSRQAVRNNNSRQLSTGDRMAPVKSGTTASPQRSNHRSRSFFNTNRSAERATRSTGRSENTRSTPSRTYSPPSRSYSPPSRSYSPPSRSYSPPSRSSGTSGGSSFHRR